MPFNTAILSTPVSFLIIISQSVARIKIWGTLKQKVLRRIDMKELGNETIT
jgi:hypothetical protein